MRKLLYGIITLTMIIGYTGCSSREPKLVNIGKAPKEESSIIKTAGSLRIRQVDGKRVISLFNKLIVGAGHRSIMVKEGQHTIFCAYNNGGALANVNVGKVNYLAGHEYIIDYQIEGRKIRYWVKDLTDNKIVLGKE
ncbi:hypothetical protein [Sulfurimonas sp.]|uniref:hypothetical protein n=1 Tax=Sulfurimonas sp. TaxID=2022749 RepID=UPI002B4A5500|nr:hypothetical protein [Sulfurimonas sp.]